MLPQKCPACKQKSLAVDQDYLLCTNCSAYRKPLHFYQKPLAWVTGRYWWWRVPILAWFVVMLVQNLHNPSFAINRLSNPFSALDLGIHELGHYLFIPFGDFMRIAGGSVFQCLFPLLWMVGFLQKKCYFAASMCWGWLGLNLFDVATYAADAKVRLLPLATGLAGLAEQGSDEAYDQAHDWYQLLTRTNHLEDAEAIAQFFRTVGTAAFFIGFVFSIILLLQMLLSSLKRHNKTTLKVKN